jgi:hypothetical protein
VLRSWCPLELDLLLELPCSFFLLRLECFSDFELLELRRLSFGGPQAGFLGLWGVVSVVAEGE